MICSTLLVSKHHDGNSFWITWSESFSKWSQGIKIRAAVDSSWLPSLSQLHSYAWVTVLSDRLVFHFYFFLLFRFITMGVVVGLSDLIRSGSESWVERQEQQLIAANFVLLPSYTSALVKAQSKELVSLFVQPCLFWYFIVRIVLGLSSFSQWSLGSSW